MNMTQGLSGQSCSLIILRLQVCVQKSLRNEKLLNYFINIFKMQQNLTNFHYIQRLIFFLLFPSQVLVLYSSCCFGKNLNKPKLKCAARPTTSSGSSSL